MERGLVFAGVPGSHRCVRAASARVRGGASDTRGAEGWANPPATSLVGLIRELTGTLRANFPERMRRLVVYPVPWAATALWTMIQQFLDAETVAKVVLLSGPATRRSPPPPELFEYVALSEIRDDLRPRHEGSSAPSE